jgi:hypothetical protein
LQSAAVSLNDLVWDDFLGDGSGLVAQRYNSAGEPDGIDGQTVF